MPRGARVSVTLDRQRTVAAAAVTLNGARVDDDTVVRAGDELEFQKAAGVKGREA